MSTGGRPPSELILPVFGPLPDETWRRKEASRKTQAEMARRTAIMHDIHMAYVEALGREVAKYGWAPRRPRSDAPVKVHHVSTDSHYVFHDVWDRFAFVEFDQEDDEGDAPGTI